MKISKSTIVRAVLVVIVLINFILERCGVDMIPTDESIILTWLELILEVAAIGVGFWKNNSFSEKAIKADKYLKMLRGNEPIVLFEDIPQSAFDELSNNKGDDK